MQLTQQKHLNEYLTTFLRQGNYAHTGDEEAILMVMQKFAKNPDQNILDVGCGPGGTANFIQSRGWGKVTGFDIDHLVIDYAKQNYSDIDFHVCNAHTTEKLFQNSIDILCLFNSFHTFNDQKKVLFSLNKATKMNGYVTIFDYLNLCEHTINPSMYNNNQKSYVFLPIRLNTLEKQLAATGWTKIEIIIINDKYQEWHTNLLTTLIEKNKNIIKMFGEQAYRLVYNKYNTRLEAIKNNMLGGVIVYAQKL